MANLKDLFPGYFVKSEKEITDIWNNAHFVFDANVILNLYRYSDETREQFFKVLDSIKDKVWLPNQAVEEYFNNRLNVISQQEKSYDDTVSALNSLEKKFDNSRQHPFVSDDSLRKISELFDGLREELNQAKGVHTNRIFNDEIKERIASIFNEKIGEEYKSDRLKEIITEGEERYKQFIPPGYKDSSKSKDKGNLQSEKRKYGDLILWFQSLDYAKLNKVSIILVCDDAKEDWWEIFQGKTIGPRPELIKEFMQFTGKDFKMYEADSFLQHAGATFGEAVTEEALKEVQSIRDDKRLSEAISKYPALRDLAEYISDNFSAGDKLPSERDIAEAIGWTRSVVREQLVRLEAYGVVSINHGKSSMLILDINARFPNFKRSDFNFDDD